MAELQVLLDPRGATSAQLRTSVGTLLDQVPAVELVGASDDQLTELAEIFGSRTLPAQRLRHGVPVLVTSGQVCFAAGAVRRIVKQLRMPGRLLTRVLVPQRPSVAGQVACWGPTWSSGYSGTLEQLIDADLDFDREHLSRESSLARLWIRADEVGVALVSAVGPDPRQWSRRVERDLRRQDLLALTRAPAGAVRRRFDRRAQRRRYAATTTTSTT